MQKTFTSGDASEEEDFDTMVNRWKKDNKDRFRIFDQGMAVAQAPGKPPIIVVMYWYEEIEGKEGRS